METGRNSPTRENETLIKPESPNTEDLNVETQEKGTVKFAIYKKYSGQISDNFLSCLHFLQKKCQSG